MANNKKISQLNPLIQPGDTLAPGDFLAIVDVTVSGFETKRTTIGNLFSHPPAIGSGVANTGEFSVLRMAGGLPADWVNAISINDDLGGDYSDYNTIATQRAVKDYVDAKYHNTFQGIQGGDTTTSEYYHLSGAEYNGLTDGGETSLHTHIHNGLTALQGGTTSQYYHLTAAEYNVLTDIHNDLSGLQGGDSTSQEYYHLTEAIHDALFSASPIIGLGIPIGTNFQVDYGTNVIAASVSSTEVMQLTEQIQTIGVSGDSYLVMDQTAESVIAEAGSEVQFMINSDGLTLYSGATVNSISTDNTFAADSDTTLVTQRAVKTYVDAAVAGVVALNVRNISSDSTAVIGDAVLVNTSGGEVTVELIPFGTAGGLNIKKVTDDTTKVILTTFGGATIDGQATNEDLNIGYGNISLLCDGTDFYII